MTPIRAIIVDDEPLAIDVLKELSSLMTPDVHILATAADGMEAMRLIVQHNPDLIFLDIDMPLLNGLELVEKMQHRNLAVIFTTGSSAHALRAIKLEAVDYLLKPIDPADFVMAVDKARYKLFPSPTHVTVKPSNRLQLPTHQGIFFLEESDIWHITGKGSYSQLMTKDDTIMVSKNIGQLEMMLSDQFCRCHNSHIINVNYVKSFYNKDGFYVLLKDGTEVEVSRRSKEKLLMKLTGKQGGL